METNNFFPAGRLSFIAIIGICCSVGMFFHLNYLSEGKYPWNCVILAFIIGVLVFASLAAIVFHSLYKKTNTDLIKLK